MILIISKFGATNRYPDQKMMRRTLGAFLKSLDRQTDREFRLFMPCHDVPQGFDYPWLEWVPLKVDSKCQKTSYWKHLPSNLEDPGEMQNYTYGSKTDDSGRKTIHGGIVAGKWAYKNGLKDFWMLRMDSDDMLAKRMIETIHALGKLGYDAVYNTRCHIFDPKTGEIGEYNNISSTTCNALRMRVDRNVLPRWLYLCRNHTKFKFDVRRDKIKARVVDWAYCITTNSGNSISARPALTREKHARKIAMTKELLDRYGLEGF